MARADSRTIIRRRRDGLAQLHVLQSPLSMGALRTFGLGLVGAVLLLAALVATPFFMALGARSSASGRSAAPHVLPPR